MKRKVTLFIFIVILSGKIFCQNVSAFVDNNGSFYIFDNESVSLYESQKPTSFKIGGNCIAYIDYASTFKIYYKGEILTPCGERLITDYQVSHNLVFFSIGKKAFVFNQGKTELLTDHGYNYRLKDSLIAFQDWDTKSLIVYSNDQVDTLATPNQNVLRYSGKFGAVEYGYNCEVGKNIVAFMDKIDFKIFWHDTVFNVLSAPTSTVSSTQPNFPPGGLMNFQAGNNIVSFVNPIKKTFSVFYKGLFYDLPSKHVTSFKTGDDMVAYSDSLGLHVFYAGRNYDLGPAPSNYYSVLKLGMSANYFSVKDSILTYFISGHFKVFSNGKITEIDNVNISQFQMDNNLFAWIDRQNNLNALYNGKIFTLSTLITPTNYTVFGGTIWFNVFPNEDKIFCKGQIYHQ